MNLKQIISAENSKLNNPVGSYNFIESGFSVRPQKKYCDFTGFHSRYTDKKTGLKYFSSDFFNMIESMTFDHLKQRDIFNNKQIKFI